MMRLEAYAKEQMLSQWLAAQRGFFSHQSKGCDSKWRSIKPAGSLPAWERWHLAGELLLGRCF